MTKISTDAKHTGKLEEAQRTFDYCRAKIKKVFKKLDYKRAIPKAFGVPISTNGPDEELSEDEEEQESRPGSANSNYANSNDDIMNAEQFQQLLEAIRLGDRTRQK